MSGEKPDYIPEPLRYEPEPSLRGTQNGGHWLKFFALLLFSVVLSLGCVVWSWAILVGFFLGMGFCVVALFVAKSELNENSKS